MPFIYEMGPMDYFEGSIPLSEFLPLDDASISSDGFCALLCGALWGLAKYTSWEGDVKQGTPRIVGLPEPDYAQVLYAVIVKQDNNGSTYIWSQFEMPWLGASLYERSA